jgi:hypothetical protein
MRKKSSTIIGLAIATILTAYMSGLLSNQAFAQRTPGSPNTSGVEQFVWKDLVSLGANARITDPNAKITAHIGQALGGLEQSLLGMKGCCALETHAGPQSLLGMKGGGALETSAGEHLTGQHP